MCGGALSMPHKSSCHFQSEWQMAPSGAGFLVWGICPRKNNLEPIQNAPLEFHQSDHPLSFRIHRMDLAVPQAGVCMRTCVCACVCACVPARLPACLPLYLCSSWAWVLGNPHLMSQPNKQPKDCNRLCF